MKNTVPAKEMLQALKDNSSNSRYSHEDFVKLVHSILADPDYKIHKYLFRKDGCIEMDYNVNKQMMKFLGSLLKHAGISDDTERTLILESFEFSPRDIEWLIEAVDTAEDCYLDCGKSLRKFREQIAPLTLRRVERTGKYAGRPGYSKSVKDRKDLLARYQAEGKVTTQED